MDEEEVDLIPLPNSDPPKDAKLFWIKTHRKNRGIA